MATGRQAKRIRSSGKDTEQRPLTSGNGGRPAHEKTNASESDRERPSLTDRVGKDAKREWATFNKTECAFTCRPSDPAPRTVPKGHTSNDVPRMRERRPREDDGAHGRLATRWRSPGHGRRAPSGSRSRGARAGAAFFLLKKGKLGKEPHTRDAGHTRAQTPRGTPNPETCEDAEDGAGRPTGGAFLSGDRFVESWLWKHIQRARGRRRNSPR